ncbi:MAG: hypothetical protein ACHP84_04795 [Caulobacterales bacterium]
MGISVTAVPPAAAVAPAPSSATEAPPHAALGQNAAPAARNLALVIEDNKAAGEYVYKTVDRSTGEVVSQWPSKQLVQLRESSNYAPGALVKQLA